MDTIICIDTVYMITVINSGDNIDLFSYEAIIRQKATIGGCMTSNNTIYIVFPMSFLEQQALHHFNSITSVEHWIKNPRM